MAAKRYDGHDGGGRKRRGVSFGTLFMLVFSLAVVLACAWLLPRLSGGSADEIRMDAGKIVEALSASISLDRLSPQTVNPSAAEPTQGSLSFITAAPTVLPTRVPSSSLLLVMGGEVTINKAIRQSGYDSKTKTYDFSPILTDVRSLLRSADVALVPFQSQIAVSGSYTDLNAPQEALFALADAGVDVLLMGGATALQGGIAGLSDTIGAVKSAGMTPAGVFASADDARNTHMFSASGLKTALLRYTDALSTRSRNASSESERAYAVPLIDEDRIYQDIQAARLSGAQIVIVSLSWGKAGKTAPTDEQRELAQKIADYGADILIGSGAGAVQGAEIISGYTAERGKHDMLTVYSIGSMITSETGKAYTAGAVLRAQISYDADSQAVTFDEVGYIPTYLWKTSDGSKTVYRLVVSDGKIPDGMGGGTQKSMQAALEITEKAFEGSGIGRYAP
ncbi:MAG: CapA family protein [Eubacteriales bacterium]|nr:CapA family protein [Eubacteriales bacterium]MDD3881325.1 CapA family protein [Eubacteriales bacterium]MDD4513699.1 CapA family protein [Eubacteriales bacterium]